jgi:methylenetetrahydrofolate reductase (NADPH)
MSLAESFNAGRFNVGLEITPPRSSLPSVLLRRARLLGDAPAAINVIQRPGRQPSLDAAIELQAAGIEAVWHLVTRGKSRAALDSELRVAREAGIHNILCIRGDHPGGPPDEFTVRDACEAAAAGPGALVGATLNQYVPDRGAVLRNLLPKLRAGARYVQTQPVFEPDALVPVAEAVLQASPETRVVAMAMPLTSLDAAARIEARLGMALPPAVTARLSSGDEDAPWAAFTETLAALVASPFMSGVALMTFEVDASPETAGRMLAALQASGAIPHEPASA